MGTLPTNRVYDWQPEDFVMSDVFSGYYANFIKTGNPNGLGLTEWLPINGNGAAMTLRLDIDSEMLDDVKTEQRYEALDGLMTE